MQYLQYLLPFLPLLVAAQDVNSIVQAAQSEANADLAAATQAANSAGLDTNSLLKQASQAVASFTTDPDVAKALSTAAAEASSFSKSISSAANSGSSAASSAAKTASGSSPTGGAAHNVKPAAGAIGVGLAALMVL